MITRLNVFKNKKGQGMVEYALLLALIVIVSIAMLRNIGVSTNAQFTAVDAALAPAP